MEYTDYKEAIYKLSNLSWELEQMYEENGGECTDETEQMELLKESIGKLLSNEGADFLGRWLLQKENEKKMYKAEKDSADARIKACDNTIDFIKGQIGTLMNTLGEEKIKGEYYSFSPSVSTTTKADTAAIKDKWYGLALAAIRSAGVPEYITITLGASVSAVPEGEDRPDVFITSTKQTCKFTKPRASKEDK